VLVSDWDCVVAHWRRELLNRCTVKSCTQGSNPCLSANESYECKSLCQKELEFSPFPRNLGIRHKEYQPFIRESRPKLSSVRAKFSIREMRSTGPRWNP